MMGRSRQVHPPKRMKLVSNGAARAKRHHCRHLIASACRRLEAPNSPHSIWNLPVMPKYCFPVFPKYFARSGSLS